MINHTPEGFRETVIHAAARAFFVCAYADHVEDEDRDDDIDYPRPSGGDWFDYAPDATPLNAYVLAGEMWSAVEIASKINMWALAARANEADGGVYAIPDHFDTKSFGHYLAMEYMGHGVSWFDDHSDFPITIPHCEIGAYSFEPECYHEEL